MKKDPRIDAYISKAQPFARPILTRLRKMVHSACPGATETMKWSFPHFEYNGAILCSMASFKEHCAFGFWKATLMKDSAKLMSQVGETAMGHLGKIRRMEDLPADKILTAYIKEAAKLNEKQIKTPRIPKHPKPELKIPGYFREKLKTNKKASAVFEAFSPSHKREYVEWVTEAKTEETRNRRMDTAIEWMAEGKIRNWKYVKK